MVHTVLGDEKPMPSSLLFREMNPTNHVESMRAYVSVPHQTQAVGVFTISPNNYLTLRAQPSSPLISSPWDLIVNQYYKIVIKATTCLCTRLYFIRHIPTSCCILVLYLLLASSCCIPPHRARQVQASRQGTKAKGVTRVSASSLS